MDKNLESQSMWNRVRVIPFVPFAYTDKNLEANDNNNIKNCFIPEGVEEFQQKIDAEKSKINLQFDEIFKNSNN